MCEFVVAWRRVRPCARLWEHAYPAGDSLQSPSASRSFIKSIQLYAYPAGAYFCMRASSRALLHIGLLSLWDRQPSNAPPLLLSPAGLASRRGPHTKTHLGLCPKTPLPLSCGWIRSQGACSAFCSGFSRDQIKNQPYKRHRVGRNLRLSRADPALCSGQPSPPRCILLSPQGLATLRGPRLYGAYRRVGGLGVLPG